MQNRIILLLFIVSVFLCIGGLYFFTNPSDIIGKKVVDDTISKTQNKEDTAQNKPENMLSAGKQSPGKMLVIDSVILKNGGYVIVYENTSEPTGEILGASQYLSVGEHTNISISLSRKVTSGEFFNAMIHGDNGDHVFDIVKDAPLRDKDGNGYFINIEIQ
jgi:hypothetical protein